MSWSLGNSARPGWSLAFLSTLLLSHVLLSVFQSTWILGWKHRDTYWLLENSVSEERVEECRGRMEAELQILAVPSLRPGGRGGAGQGREADYYSI